MENRFRPVGGAFLLADALPEPFAPERFGAVSRLIGETADRFLRDEILPEVERIEAGEHARMLALMQRAGALGLLAADVPVCYGGLGLDTPTAALIAEKVNPQQSFALTHEAHTVIATLPLLYFGTPAQKARYLPKLASGEWVGAFALSEADSGSDALAMRTRARRSAEGYRLQGMKTWITNAGFARLFTVFARVEQGFGAFLVERDFPGLSFGPEERKLGMRGTSTRRVMLDEVPVPAENALAEGKGHYAALCALNLGRFKLQAGAVGGMKELLALCCAYAGERRAFGRPLAAHGLVQRALAEMAAQTYALESMVYRLAGDLENAFAPIDADAEDASARYHRAAEEYAIECNVVKILGSEAYSALADEAIQLHGGYGYTENFALARAWRDQRLLRIGEGANEVVRIALVQQLLRREKAGRLPLFSGGLPLARDDDFGAGDAARLARLLLARAVDVRGGAGLAEAQEVAAAVADVVCAAYALQSVALRAAHFGSAAARLLADVASLGHRERAVRAAQGLLADLELDGGAEIAHAIARLAFSAGSPMRLRRGLATLALERGGWPLA